MTGSEIFFFGTEKRSYPFSPRLRGRGFRPRAALRRNPRPRVLFAPLTWLRFGFFFRARGAGTHRRVSVAPRLRLNNWVCVPRFRISGIVALTRDHKATLIQSYSKLSRCNVYLRVLGTFSAYVACSAAQYFPHSFLHETSFVCAFQAVFFP